MSRFDVFAVRRSPSALCARGRRAGPVMTGIGIANLLQPRPVAPPD